MMRINNLNNVKVLEVVDQYDCVEIRFAEYEDANPIVLYIQLFDHNGSFGARFLRKRVYLREGQEISFDMVSGQNGQAAVETLLEKLNMWLASYPDSERPILENRD